MDLKKIQRQEKQSLGRLISNLLAQALGKRQSVKRPIQKAPWISKPMGVRVDLADHPKIMEASTAIGSPLTINKGLTSISWMAST